MAGAEGPGSLALPSMDQITSETSASSREDHRCQSIPYLDQGCKLASDSSFAAKDLARRFHGHKKPSLPIFMCRYPWYPGGWK